VYEQNPQTWQAHAAMQHENSPNSVEVYRFETAPLLRRDIRAISENLEESRGTAAAARSVVLTVAQSVIRGVLALLSPAEPGLRHWSAEAPAGLSLTA
jgi:hypothetical protein